MEYKNVVSGKFISRPNRFIAHVVIDGQEEIVHVEKVAVINFCQLSCAAGACVGAAVGAAEILVRFAVTVLVFLQLKEVLGLRDQAQIALALPTACGKIARE